MQEYQKLTHPFDPFYDRDSEILILGSFPSVKSREQKFFYGHPQNRFWKVIAGIYEIPVPGSIEEKKEMLKSLHIALWDVIAECEITGSSDASIRNAVPTDLSRILSCADIRRIYTNGGTATRLYEKFQRKSCGRETIGLPSTSPANAAWSLERLKQAWQKALQPES